MTQAKAGQVKAAGVRPCLVQQSSADNLQAVVKVPKAAREDEQSLANALVQEMNRKWGDAKFSGVVHPFRMAGFANKKPGKQNAFTRVLEMRPEPCSRTADALKQIRKEADAKREQEAQKARQIERQERTSAITREIDERPAGDAATAYRRAAAKVQRWVKARGLAEDWSRIDFQAAKAMLKDGWTGEEVQRGMLAGSPGVIDRHNDPTDYAARTTRNAAAESDVVKHLAEQARQRQQSRGMGFSR